MSSWSAGDERPRTAARATRGGQALTAAALMATNDTASAQALADAASLRALANGDLQALGALYDRHAPALERTFARWGIADGDVDDLVQATFLQVARAAAHFDPTQSPRGWLFGIAGMIVRRHRRSLVRRLARLARWSASASERPPPTPGDVYEADEARRRVERTLARLSPKKRDVFVLVTLEGLSGQEAAQALGIPLKTVWTRLHHARRVLRAALEEEGP